MSIDYLTCRENLLEPGVGATYEQVQRLDPHWVTQAENRQADLTKPAGSLGTLEAATNRVCAINETLSPAVDRPAVAVFAADHGVVGQQVSAWPQDVTSQMFTAVVAGMAAINVLAGRLAAPMMAVNMGLASDPDVASPAEGVQVVQRCVARGTTDFTHGPAMSVPQAQRAFLCGAEAADTLVAQGANLLIAGDLGIGNTTSSAALIALVMGVDPALVTGRGAGADDASYERKKATVAAGVSRHQPASGNTWQSLAAVGGFEHCAMAGFYARAAAHRVPAVLDGVISCAAALAAVKLCPGIGDYLVAGHRSVEPGASAVLTYLGLDPVMDASLRLGEGTGAALAVPLIQGGVATMSKMARFSALGIDAGQVDVAAAEAQASPAT